MSTLSPHEMMTDPDWSVRLEVAERIDPSRLHEMMEDEDPEIRIVVAQRIDPSRIPEMMGDPDPWVRYWVVKRISSKYLGLSLMRESVPEILEIIRERLNKA